MKIAIVSFQKNTDVIGAKYIHAYLRKHHYESYLILQPNSDVKSNDAIYDFIRRNDIAVVGISLMSPDFFRASRFAEGLKSRFPGIPLVFGGAHATIAPEECLSQGDVVVRGEGEHAFLELVQHIEQGRDFSRLPGICVKRNHEILLNPPRPLEPNLDCFPFPGHSPPNMLVIHRGKARRLSPALFRKYSRYSGTFPSIATTRGCPFSCTYCCNSAYKKLYGKYTVRKRSVASVISECVELRQKSGVLAINVQDDCFLANNVDWIHEFAVEYRSHVGLPFAARSTPRHVTKKKLELLKKAGLAWVFVGFQSGSERINREIYKRNMSNEDFLRAASVVKDINLCALYDVILDNPYEEEADVLETLRILLRVPKPFQMQLASLCLYQGTELNAKAVEDGIAFSDPRVKNFANISNTLLNQLIGMVPTYPRGVVRYLMDHRKEGLAGRCVGLCHFLNVRVLQHFALLRLMHRAFGSHMAKTLRLAVSFGQMADPAESPRSQSELAADGPRRPN